MSSTSADSDPSANHLKLYFRSAFLNGWRDEVWLTITLQAKTLHHFLALLAFATGVIAGCMQASASGNWALIFVGIAGGIAGFFAFWSVLPRLEWWLILTMYRKGWWLEKTAPTVKSAGDALLTAEVFAERGRLYTQKDTRLSMIYAGILVCLAMPLYYLEKFQDETFERFAIPIILCFVIVFWIAIATLRRARKKLGEKLQLLCPSCSRLITGLDGGFGVPPYGCCKHCGTKVFTDVPFEQPNH